MNPQQFRDKQMQYEWWKQHGGGSNNGGGCGCLLLLLIVGAIALMLMSGCSSRLPENNSVKPVSLTLSLSQETFV